ncbi:hypothetical protein BDN71DRAFT_1436931 [Pleurotus eryngii]|uniref:Uncharacterized protein n=1 Tax=Pleurotus eryngii TaxID=5323 RepID=A0A9P5ZHT0_PLEER|nr:hypothetical protein BDN71DRAFT_1436931 [Pleurotus eryngii]
MDKSYFTINSHPITFSNFKEYTVDLVSRAEMRLYQVLHGCDLDDIDTKIKTTLQIGDHQNTFHYRLHDMDTRNPLKTERNQLLKHFLREGCDEFSTSVAGSTYFEAFKPAHGLQVNCHIWLDEVDSLVSTIIDPRLARMFIIMTNFVYYAVSAICAQLKKHEQSVAYTRYMFVLKGKPMNVEQMMRVLQEHTKPVFHKGFGIRDWQHIMKFLLRYRAGIWLDPEDKENSDKDHINTLFGHGGHIGNHVYAIESSSLSTNSVIDINRAHQYGIEYQKALELWPGLSIETLSPNNDNKNENPSNINHESLAELIRQMHANSQRQTAAALEVLLGNCITAIGNQLTSTVARTLYNDAPHPMPPHLPSSCAVNAAMYEFILQNTYTIFGILPTGGGKSLMFYSPPMEEKDSITVVISPFMALSDEQFKTAVEMGISVNHWPSKHIDMLTTRLLIVSAHAAGTNKFISLIRVSVEQGLIHRIIYNKAHQILLSPAYRDCYDTLPLITQTGVCVHFLSATLLQSSVDEIIHITCIPPDTAYTI